MRLVYIAAGAGGTHCGACARDLVLVRGLIARGHDVMLLPVYTPLRIEGDDVNADRVMLGGINAWLQQNVGFAARHGLGWIETLLDHPAFLRLVMRFAVDTEPEKLGAMTVSVLEGVKGRQRRELDKLVAFLRHGPDPDAFVLTNALLSGLVQPLKEAFGCPVVCHLQGGEAFLRRLGTPHTDKALALLRDNARLIDRFTTPVTAHVDDAAHILDVDRSLIHVVLPCVDTRVFHPCDVPPTRCDIRTLGYLSRLTPIKGLDLLADAATRVFTAAGCPAWRIRIAGEAHGRSERRFLREALARLERGGLSARDSYVGVPDLDGKVSFLQSLDLFSIPSRQTEMRSIACLEALACGVPAILPARGIFIDLIEKTGGGLLYDPEDTDALAETLADAVSDSDRLQKLGMAAAAGVRRHFSADAALDCLLPILEGAVQAASSSCGCSCRA